MSFISDSDEAIQSFLEAEDIALRASQPLTSTHLLLAMFTFPNRARVLLNERSLDEECILHEVQANETEPVRTVAKLRERAREIAKNASSSQVDCLHMLIAITRMRETLAHRVLERAGAPMAALRNVAVGYMTGTMPRRLRTLQTTAEQATGESKADGKVSRTSRAARAASMQIAEALPEAPKPPSKINRHDAAPTIDIDEAPVRQSPSSTDEVESIAPTLAQCGVNLTELAKKSGIDGVSGRTKELDALIDILGKRRSNNPILVGPPGVGKTAIVEGLAHKLLRGERDVAHFRNAIVFSLDTGALVAGTSLRGSFSERLNAIKAEVAAAKGRIIVFIDELHTLIGSGSVGDSGQDAGNELKAALARGEFPCIGATTPDEYKRSIEKDPALERRFTPIHVAEPTPEATIGIVEDAIASYAEHHQVTYGLDAIHAAVQMSHRFITERHLPDKAFAVLDLAGSRAKRRGVSHVSRLDVAKVVHDWSDVPLERLSEADAERLQRAEALIAEKFIGHAHVVEAVCNALRRGFAGFNGQRPMGSFLFLGPTGVGKTELVKALAEFLFGKRDAIVRIDMSELSERHSVARLIGAQPGYVGYEEGGQLTEALRRRPFQVVLLDEIEKAHPDVLNLLLQILDEGKLTDSHGRTVSFANTLVVLTSNIGADVVRQFAGSSRGIGFSSSADRVSTTQRVLAEAQRRLLPELWGRLDERLVFDMLSREDVQRIALLQLQQSAKTLLQERELTLEWDDNVIDLLLDAGGYDPDMGARGMRQTIQRYVEAPLAQAILGGNMRRGESMRAVVDESSSAIRFIPVHHTARLS